MREHRDALLLGPPGTGKSYVGQAIGWQAIKQGFVVLYRSIFDVVRDFLHEDVLGDEDKALTALPKTRPVDHRRHGDEEKSAASLRRGAL